MSELPTECGSCCQLFSEGVLLQVTQDDWWCPSCVLEYANTQSHLRIELRRAIIAGGESPAEQYSSIDTLNLLRTRWMPVKEHNEKVRSLEQENAKLRERVAELERDASRGRALRLAKEFLESAVSGEVGDDE